MVNTDIVYPKNYFKLSSEVLLSLDDQIDQINSITKGIFDSFTNGGKILIAGNGGSNSDAEHFAGELTCTYKNSKRIGFPAISLGNNSSAITAWGNDFGFETYFQRQVHSLGNKNDILFLISTGGGNLEKKISLNLILAANEAKQKNMKVFSIIGKSGGELEKISDEFVKVKSFETSHIQEAHIAIIHYICESLDTFESDMK